MNNASGSILRKLSFALALGIAAAVGYVAVRYRLRMDQERADTAIGTAPPPSSNSNAAVVATTSSKPEYLPLRARVQTNVVWLGTNRPSTAPRPVERLPEVARAGDTVVTKVVARNVGISGGALVGGRAFVPKPSSVSGRVIFRGTPPRETVAAVDAACGQLRTTPLTTRHYVVGSNGGFANAFVYIKSGAPAGGPSIAPPALDQVGCEYQPYMIGVRTGQTFLVRNSDAVFHNVNAAPGNPGNRPKNVAQPTKGMKTPFVFAAPDLFVRFKCDVHPWMFAYVGVVEHPWFAVTDSDGNFSFPAGLPPGQYTVAAIHLKAGTIAQQINVTETGVEPVTFTFDLPNEMAKSNSP